MPEENWSLDQLYLSLDSNQFKNDFKECTEKIEYILSWANANFNSNDNAKQKLEYYISFSNSFESKLSKLGEYCQLVFSTNASNNKALKAMESIEDMISNFTPIDTMFIKWISALEIDDLISSSDLLKEHEFFIKETKEKSRHILSEKEEIIISKMRSTGSLAWSKLWEFISSTLLIEINGEKQPLPAIRNMAYNKDKILRKTAYEAEIKALESISQTSASALNSIKGEVITTCKMRGYNSPLEMTLLESRIGKDVLDSMISAMQDYLPVFRKYLKAKAKKLGHDNSLPFYDLFAPIGDIDMSYSYEEAKSFVIENFNEFSLDLGNYAKNAFENRWIDVYPKEGKRGGAFCSNLHSIKESRILTNFSGSFNDVITLTHELGHGYHGHCLNECSHINSNYPMPIAETASTFCETIVKNAAIKKATDKQKLFILENDISDNTQIIVDILSRFIFEEKLFNERKNGSLSACELCEIMLNAQKETYGDGLDENCLHKYMWIVKPHYYDADFNYYNFPYAFGLLFAKGLYSVYLEKGSSFSNDYVKILSATGCHNHKDIALMAGIDITEKVFWRNSLEIMKKDIEDYIALI